MYVDNLFKHFALKRRENEQEQGRKIDQEQEKVLFCCEVVAVVMAALGGKKVKTFYLTLVNFFFTHPTYCLFQIFANLLETLIKFYPILSVNNLTSYFVEKIELLMANSLETYQ